MHIPFSRDKGALEGTHIITLSDNSNQEQGVCDDPSPDLFKRATTLRHKIPDAIENLVHPPMQQVATSGNDVVDVLYENQRGSFICGIPLFSAAGLWMCDPHGWTSFDHRFSPFNIFNATLPDPTWEWVWARWFVDMSGDVDENGWTYNLNFTKHHWHGYHIWYHSFVRRRRWLRKRRKISISDRVVRRQKNPVEDYFTLYSATRSPSKASNPWGPSINMVLDDDESDMGYSKLENLGDFYQTLRAARLDREKLDAVDNYLAHGKDLHSLAGQMRHILRFMIFQESRRQLLTLMTQRCQEMEKNHGQGCEKGRHQCVLDAIEMTELLLQKLKYFSDREKLEIAEQDAELDRILALRLDEQDERRRLSINTPEHLHDFHPPKLAETMEASKTDPTRKDDTSPVDADNDAEEREGEGERGEEAYRNATRFTAEQKGKGKEK